MRQISHNAQLPPSNRQQNRTGADFFLIKLFILNISYTNSAVSFFDRLYYIAFKTQWKGYRSETLSIPLLPLNGANKIILPVCLPVLSIFTGKLPPWKAIHKKSDIMSYTVNANCNDSKWNTTGTRVGEQIQHCITTSTLFKAPWPLISFLSGKTIMNKQSTLESKL